MHEKTYFFKKNTHQIVVLVGKRMLDTYCTFLWQIPGRHSKPLPLGPFGSFPRLTLLWVHGSHHIMQKGIKDPKGRNGNKGGNEMACAQGF